MTWFEWFLWPISSFFQEKFVNKYLKDEISKRAFFVCLAVFVSFIVYFFSNTATFEIFLKILAWGAAYHTLITNSFSDKNKNE